MTRRAGAYYRISRDRDGTGLAIERQRAEAEALIVRRGWTAAGEWSDPAVTASGKRRRPGFAAMLDAIADGRVDAVVAWDLPRLARNPRDRLALVEACRDRGVVVSLVRGSDMDPTTASGRMLIGILGEVAEAELGTITERVQAEKRQAAAAGRYRGGPRPFGYEPDGRTLREPEAEAVRDATRRILAGESVRGVVRVLNDAGLTTSTGRPWSAVTVRRMLTRARNAGLLEHEHRDRPRAAEPDVVGPGDWPAIVTEAQWRQVRRILADPARRVSPSNDHRWLLAGVALCGRCDDGTTVRSGTAKSGGVYVPAYKCSRHAHLSRLIEPVDDVVNGIVVARLRRSDVAAAVAPPEPTPEADALHAERAELVARRADLAALVADGTLSAADVRFQAGRIQGEIDRLDGALAAAVEIDPVAELARYGDDVAARWAAAPVSTRKAVVRTLMSVTIMPGRPGRQPGGGYFDPASVRIEWR